MNPLLRFAPLLLSVLVVACGGTSASSALQGPDAGAGCDSSIHAHCVFARGIGEPMLGYAPVCVEYSGASPDPSSCKFGDSLVVAPGQFATGPCPRDQYDKSCAFSEAPATDAGSCAAFATIWSDSTQWNPDAGLVGYPACIAQ